MTQRGYQPDDLRRPNQDRYVDQMLCGGESLLLAQGLLQRLGIVLDAVAACRLARRRRADERNAEGAKEAMDDVDNADLIEVAMEARDAALEASRGLLPADAASTAVAK